MPFTAAPSAFWLFANAVSKHFISLICRTFAADFFMVSVSSARSQWSSGSEFIQRGKFMHISFMGNSKSMRDNICLISSSLSSKQFTGCTGMPYFSVNLCANSCASGDSGYIQFSSIINGLFMAFNSSITRSSASSYSLRGISLMLPSVVITKPIVECSFITLRVPISAAILNGMGSSNHGVITIRGWSPSIYPSALGTM